MRTGSRPTVKDAWRDALFPRTAFRRAWDMLAKRGPIERACRIMVALLDIAYCSGREAELAEHIEIALDALAEKGLAAGLDLVARCRVDHVVVVRGDGLGVRPNFDTMNPKVF